MKRLISGLCTAAALAAVSACADYHDRGYGGGLYVGGGYYDGYYDDYYGPIYDGYWDGDDFYFRDRADHAWRRDTEHHFRRDSAPGFHSIHGEVHGATRRDGDHPH